MKTKPIELKNFMYPDLVEAGCDEAGRGCLAGPVFAAAVILPKDFRNDILNDSKLLSNKQRRELVPVILEKATAYSVFKIDNTEIDKINILQASIKAMQNAVSLLSITPEHLLIDGNRFNKFKIPHTCVIKGDSKYLSIAAASVLAKTYRDDYMEEISKLFPEYFWNINKGYPTKKHRDAIKKFGITGFHRKTFKLLPVPEIFDIFQNF